MFGFVANSLARIGDETQAPLENQQIGSEIFSRARRKGDDIASEDWTYIGSEHRSPLLELQ
jgi:hypothetical protein